MINYLLGQKVSIVSRKVQTTRFSTKGILNIENSGNNKPDCQIIFVDTPGLFEPKKALEKHIVKNTISELNNYEHICILYDANSSSQIPWQDGIFPLIDSLNDLEFLNQELKKKSYIAVDTEFRRTTKYNMKLGLLQINDEDEIYIIDHINYYYILT